MLPIESLTSKLRLVKTKQKELEFEEIELKKLIMELMQEANIDVFNDDNGTVHLQSREQKIYGEEVTLLDSQLKDAKSLANDMGDYTITGYKKSLVYNFPKDLV